MERLDLSSYAKDIKSSYDKVASGGATYAIYTTQKDSSLKPTSTGDGDIQEFVSEFEEGAVQFGVIRVNPFGSDVNKLLLLCWCPDSAPLKSRVSFAQNSAEIGKTLHYHVQVNARDPDDLDVDDLMKTVSNASGARYSIQSLQPKPTSSFKPKPKPASAVKPVASNPIAPKPSALKPVVKSSKTEDEWGGEKEIEERDFSEKPLDTLPSAYKPTKVDIDQLRKGTDSTTSGYGTKPSKKPDFVSSSSTPQTISLTSTGLSSLPKPKTTNSVSSRYSAAVQPSNYGTKAPSFDAIPKNDSTKLVGGLSRNFGASSGKTPAQLWAEKKGQFKTVPKDEKPVNSIDEEGKEDVGIEDVKSKYENLTLQAKKEEKSTKSPLSATTSTFPPPPPTRTVKATPPPSSFDKAKEEPKEDTANEWGDEDDEPETPPAPLPARPTPAAAPAPVAPVPVKEPSPEPQPEPVAITPPEPEATPKEEETAGTASAIAEYDYEKEEDNEIAFDEGELITKIKFVDQDWWFGFNKKGESGLFPAAFVTLQKESATATGLASAATAAAESTKEEGPSAIAEYDYDATEANELTFKEGDLITDIEKVDEDWWLGSLNGDRKLFPANFVTLKE